MNTNESDYTWRDFPTTTSTSSSTFSWKNMTGMQKGVLIASVVIVVIGLTLGIIFGIVLRKKNTDTVHKWKCESSHCVPDDKNGTSKTNQCCWGCESATCKNAIQGYDTQALCTSDCANPVSTYGCVSDVCQAGAGTKSLIRCSGTCGQPPSVHTSGFYTGSGYGAVLDVAPMFNLTNATTGTASVVSLANTTSSSTTIQGVRVTITSTNKTPTFTSFSTTFTDVDYKPNQIKASNGNALIRDSTNALHRPFLYDHVGTTSFQASAIDFSDEPPKFNLAVSVPRDYTTTPGSVTPNKQTFVSDVGSTFEKMWTYNSDSSVADTNVFNQSSIFGPIPGVSTDSSSNGRFAIIIQDSTAYLVDYYPTLSNTPKEPFSIVSVQSGLTNMTHVSVSAINENAFSFTLSNNTTLETHGVVFSSIAPITQDSPTLKKTFTVSEGTMLASAISFDATTIAYTAKHQDGHENIVFGKYNTSTGAIEDTSVLKMPSNAGTYGHNIGLVTMVDNTTLVIASNNQNTGFAWWSVNTS